jgi:GH25 family lysozyme M1 (1,4-beta-N-acetylmuramidase)
MKNHSNTTGDKKISRRACTITIIILLCLLLACGVFVILSPASPSDQTGPDGSTAAQEAPSGSMRTRLYNWLGMDSILAILHGKEESTVVKADPSAVTISGETGSSPQADKGSSEAGAAKPADKSTGGTAAEKAPAAETGTAGKAQTSADGASAAKTEGSAKEDSAKKDPQKEKSKEEDPKKESAKKDIFKKEKEISSPTKLQKKYIRAWEDWHMRDFTVNFPLHNYNWKYLSYDESGKLRYEGDKEYTIRNGIDVSEFQGAIDWKKVKKAGYDFVFVRAGHRTMHTGDLQRDNRAIKNIRRAKKAGLDVGVYVFSQAITEEEAREEAELCLDVIKDSGVEITLPVVFDPEIVIEDYYARINYISGEQFTDNAVAFSETVEKAGFTPAIYANCSTETDILDMSRLKGSIIWYADYGLPPESPYDFTFWQYSNLGWVEGIPETETDLNVWFVEKEE